MSGLGTSVTAVKSETNKIALADAAAGAVANSIANLVGQLAGLASGGAPAANSFLDRVLAALTAITNKVGAADPGAAITAQSYLDRLAPNLYDNGAAVLTAGVGAGVMGAYQVIINAASGRERCVTIELALENSPGTYKVDIAVAGVIVLANLVITPVAGAFQPMSFFFPLRISAGAQVTARTSHSIGAGTETIFCAIWAWYNA